MDEREEEEPEALPVLLPEDFPVALLPALEVVDFVEPALALVPEVPVEEPDLLAVLRLEVEDAEGLEEELLPEEVPDELPCIPAAIIAADMLLPGSFEEEEDLEPEPIEALEPEIPDD